MADMVAVGLLDLSPPEHVVHPLERVNEAVSGTARRNGWFSNLTVSPIATA